MPKEIKLGHSRNQVRPPRASTQLETSVAPVHLKMSHPKGTKMKTVIVTPRARRPNFCNVEICDGSRCGCRSYQRLNLLSGQPRTRPTT